MKAYVRSLDGKKGQQITLPAQFDEAHRPDLIKRAVSSIQSNNRQPYGTDPRAGLRTSAKHVARRSIYGSWANRGLSRMKRIGRGNGPLTGTARVSPHAVKGRRTHPPKAEKDYGVRISKSERRFAIRSAITATASKEVVAGRGHKVGTLDEVPVVCDGSLESIAKTKDAMVALEALGLSDDLERASVRKVRSGKGTMRGRVYRRKKGPLVVVSKDGGVSKALKNIAGVDVVNVKDLNADVLAPGAHPGRLTVWTKSAIDALDKEKLFM